MYGVGRYLFGIVGGAGSVLFLFLDPGAADLFGWAQCFSLGVWPMTLSGGLVLAVIFLYSVGLQSQYCKVGLWFGLAILTALSVLFHVFSIMAIVLNALILTFVFFLFAKDLSTTLKNIVY